MVDMTAEHPRMEATTFALSGGKLDELELLIGGLYWPADGYCLPSLVPEYWPAPFVLEVPSAVGLHAMGHGTLILTDPDGAGLARLHIDQGKESPNQDSIYLAGKLSGLRDAEHPPARHLRITRSIVGASPSERAYIAAVFSATPRPWEIAGAMNEASDASADLWLVAVCGPQDHGRYTVSSLLTELESTSAQIPGSKVRLLVFPTDIAEASPVERRLQDHVLNRIGATRILDFSAPRDAPKFATATENGVPRNGTVVFLTGLSGSGKSTVARALAESVNQDTGKPVALLDGDDVRRILSPGLGFSNEERETNIQRIGWVASLVSRAGGFAICAPIAPFDVGRKQVRQMAEDAGNFLLVHISTPLAECEARDRKGLYAKARKGELKEFTGIDSPYEYPHDADLHLDTSTMSMAEAVACIREKLEGSSELTAS